MSLAAPHFFLFSEASEPAALPHAHGQWRFVLETVNGDTKVEAADAEPAASGERLELLAIVRGLEALDQPSRVTLVTSSRHISRGMRYGLDQWRESDWEWERYGKMTPVKNSDLWKRIDQAMKIHTVECRAWRFDNTDDLSQSAFHAEPLPVSTVRRDRKGRTLRFDTPGSKKRERSGGFLAGVGALFRRWSAAG